MSTNPITGDQLKSKSTTEAYRNNWDLIFSKKDINKDLTNELSSEIEENDAKDPNCM
jgi:hypothetical protein